MDYSRASRSDERFYESSGKVLPFLIAPMAGDEASYVFGPKWLANEPGSASSLLPDPIERGITRATVVAQIFARRGWIFATVTHLTSARDPRSHRTGQKLTTGIAARWSMPLFQDFIFLRSFRILAGYLGAATQLEFYPGGATQIVETLQQDHKYLSDADWLVATFEQSFSHTYKKSGLFAGLGLWLRVRDLLGTRRIFLPSGGAALDAYWTFIDGKLGGARISENIAHADLDELRPEQAVQNWSASRENFGFAGKTKSNSSLETVSPAPEPGPDPPSLP